MALVAGSRLGAYKILALIGSGGMGEVYRARDTKLGRDVAIKTLPDGFTHDRGRIDRFNREAQILASLNHPHIGAIYGLEETQGYTFLILELIEGPTLADRIRNGAIPIDETLVIARQIAEALEAAHDKGIVHRDLKPANIALAVNGNVKVLDFGLAKSSEDAAPQHDVTTAISPVMTNVGVILGTAAYLSPEQAKGQSANQRSDLWAFGCVLFEMLTGRRPFSGATATDVVESIVRDRPDWTRLPADTPIAIRRLLRRCLEKNRQRRLAHASDARLDIDEAIESPATEVLTLRRRAGPVVVAALGGAAVVGVVAAAVLLRSSSAPAATPTAFAIVPPVAIPLGNPGVERDFVISPDGRFIVYRSTRGRAGGQLAVRRIDRLEPWVLEGITTAREPFFSIDSRSVGFFDGDEIKKVSLSGGPPVTICKIKGMPAGGSWGDDDTIVFATDQSTGLWRVSAQGGTPTRLTTLDAAQHEANHLYPWVLPKNRGVLFTVATDRLEAAQVAVLDFQTGQRKTLVRGGSDGKLASHGSSTYLLYASAKMLRANVFDVDRLELVGESSPVVDDLLVHGPGAAEYAVSTSGTLVYAPGTSDPQRAPRTLVWVDRKGHEEPVTRAPPKAYATPRISPDGARIVVDIVDRVSDIWVWDLIHETLTPITSGGWLYPIWTRDGRRIVFASERGEAVKTQDLFVRSADGAGAAVRLTASDVSQVPTATTTDGKYVVGFDVGKEREITLIPLNGSDGQGVVIVHSQFNELGGEVSPNGRYLAYQSDESGAYEVFVRPFPHVNDARWRISTAGGTMAAWSPNGRELFFLDGAGLLTAVPIRASGSSFSAGKPQRILETSYETPRGFVRSYDISPDGRRFLMLKASSPDPKLTQARMIVVQNWTESLQQHLAR